METINILLKLKAEIEKEHKIVNAIDEYKRVLLTILKDEFNCSSIEEAERKLIYLEEK